MQYISITDVAEIIDSCGIEKVLATLSQQLEPDSPVIELWQIITRAEQGRKAADDITVFDSVGFALEDFSTLRFLRDAAHQAGLEGSLDLIPSIDDPKNLYSLVRANAGSRAA